MKNYLRIGSLLTLLLLQLTVSAQQRVRCFTEEHKTYLRTKQPKLDEQLRQARAKAEQWAAAHPDWRNESGGLMTIPVVVHVVYNTTGQNISDAQVESQIDVLNEDFARLNADTANTPAPFASIAGPTPIRFCLAQRTPDDQPSTGIERRQTGTSSFFDDDAIKAFSSGGLDAWDPTRFFNIWVGPLGGGLLGYAEFPSGSISNTYGVVIAYDAFGRIGTAASPFDLGRTASHEIGHCFGLYHIWGDDGNSCSGSDGISDTPNQGGATFGCRTFPATDACTSTGNGVMFMNYMDYSDDNCLNIFTEEQATVMVGTINSFYSSLLSSDGCTPVNIAALDAGINAITSPTGAFCDTTITPVVTLRNYGANALTSVNFNYSIDGGTVSTYAWTGNLASLTSVAVNLPAISVTGGPHTFTCYTSDPNSGTDANAANDSQSSNFNVNTLGASLPVVEGFEGTFPPVNFTIENPDAATTWERSTAASHSGSAVSFLDNYNYNAVGQRDDLVLPAFDLTSISDPELSFWLAYAHYDGSLGVLTDSLEISISTDCGSTWTTLFHDGGASLNTTAGGASVTNEFVPTAGEWERFAIDLSAYSSVTSAILRFTNINGYGNQIYLDDINIDIATGLFSFGNKSKLLVYPNPAHHTFTVQTPRHMSGNGELVIRDLSGRELHRDNIQLQGATFQIDASNWNSGAYPVELTTAAGQFRVVVLIH